jgi:hypothetical protein
MKKLILALFLLLSPVPAGSQIPPLTLYPSTANLILGTPCGSAGTPLWRSICASDLTGFLATANTWTALQTFSSGISSTGVTSTSFTAVNLLNSNTAPTVSGFCTNPSVANNNGTAAFTINVGTSCATGTGTVTLPAAANGWVCDFHDVTTPGSNNVVMTGGTATTATVQNYSRTTGSAANFTSSDVIRAKCVAY